MFHRVEILYNYHLACQIMQMTDESLQFGAHKTAIVPHIDTQ